MTPKIDPWAAIFYKKGHPKTWVNPAGSVLEPTSRPTTPPNHTKSYFFRFWTEFVSILNGFWLTLDPFLMDFGGSPQFFWRSVVQPIGKTTTPRHNERRNDEMIKTMKWRTRRRQHDAARTAKWKNNETTNEETPKRHRSLVKLSDDNTTIDETTKRHNNEATNDRTTNRHTETNDAKTTRQTRKRHNNATHRQIFPKARRNARLAL